MSNLLLSLLSQTSQVAKIQFQQQTKAVIKTQEKFLQAVLTRHQNTLFGQEEKLSQIKSIDEFRSRMRVRNYDEYEPYIQQMAAGEENILTRDRAVYFNTTSGSTGKQKLIPVTKKFQNSLGWANLISIGFLSTALKKRGTHLRKLLLTNSTNISGYTSGGIPYGSGSAGVLKMGKWVYQQLFANPYETLQVSDSFARHYLCLLFALQNPETGGIVANFPMLILRTCQYLEQYSDDLIDNLKTGTIPNWLTLESHLRNQLEKQLQPQPQRAQQLQTILTRQGRLTPPQVWENLSYIATARGGTSDFYLQRFPHYLENTPVFGAAYASAEATYSIYPDLDVDGSVLAVGTGFFEFIPESEWDAKEPQTLLAVEVEIGQRYRILVTNYSGFYRYDNGDVVQVVGFYNQAPLIVFRHRRGGLISSTVEKTTEAHAVAVMQRLQTEFNLTLEDFCLTLSEKETPAHYILNIELPPDQALPNLEKLLLRFDEILKEVNPRYGAKRQDLVPPPQLHLLASGSFNIVRKRQLERGVPDSQLKFPHISEDRTLVAGLTVLQTVRSPNPSQSARERELDS
ncbi:GH3 auxin-responsive promoter [Halothece sp. PCC 7418]|uniref:GH3 auxin-responsive promoter family protein n=1 Tax=Halothece sp. (strain PCC 7418) TaxID=65093 RepID=UPI0002A08DBC|nr:GH3 auxin-responsive promoter family protein [Halothece sp. PCC 7418]AFZ45941.1 GH3 auxin-responsive promoter [Halothece sp. PCC 7418]